MHKEAKEKHFLKKPVYEGGPKAMKEFIARHLRYPEAALENKIEGTVFVKYSIDYQGNVTEAKVITSLGFGCDEEAIRVVKLLKFKVEKPRGIKVLYHKNIQIHFHLPKHTAQTGQVNLQYHYTPALPKKKVEKRQTTDSYTITLLTG